MTGKLLGVFLISFVCLVFGGCGTSHLASVQNNLNRARQTESDSTVVRGKDDAQSVEYLCKQLDRIKKLPYRDPNDSDPIYEALLKRGEEAIPCLIEMITDERAIADPREAPKWQNYKVGDTAVFLLARISNEDGFLERMLPPKYQEEWKSNGVYAYFNYVLESGNRKALKERFQEWWDAKRRDNRNVKKFGIKLSREIVLSAS